MNQIWLFPEALPMLREAQALRRNRRCRDCGWEGTTAELAPHHQCGQFVKWECPCCARPMGWRVFTTERAASAVL